LAERAEHDRVGAERQPASQDQPGAGERPVAAPGQCAGPGQHGHAAQGDGAAQPGPGAAALGEEQPPEDHDPDGLGGEQQPGRGGGQPLQPGGDRYRDTLWPILTALGDGAERLDRALSALCDVADRHLPLLLASDTAFHRATDRVSPPISFIEPLTRLIRDGAADHSLAPPEDCETTGNVVFNAIRWPYAHLRGRHGWTPAQARGLLIHLVMTGLRASPGTSAPG
jgi:hypothetical protein